MKINNPNPLSTPEVRELINYEQPMSKKKEKQEPVETVIETTDRKKPVRNPVRALFAEKGRLQFEQSELSKMAAKEMKRHEAEVEAMRTRSLAIETRLAQIEVELADGDTIKLAL